MNLIITKKNKEKKYLSPHFSIQTEQDEEDMCPHVKVIWDNHSTLADIPHIRVMWDNENPRKIKIEIDGEERSLSEIHAS